MVSGSSARRRAENYFAVPFPPPRTPSVPIRRPKTSKTGILDGVLADDSISLRRGPVRTRVDRGFHRGACGSFGFRIRTRPQSRNRLFRLRNETEFSHYCCRKPQAFISHPALGNATLENFPSFPGCAESAIEPEISRDRASLIRKSRLRFSRNAQVISQVLQLNPSR